MTHQTRTVSPAATASLSPSSLPDLSPYQALLLDAYGTLMQDVDRLTDRAALRAIYRDRAAHHPAALCDDDALPLLDAALWRMQDRYSDPTWWDRFPSLRSVLREIRPDLTDAQALPLEEAVAEQEVGRIAPETAAALHRLAGRFRLMLVSNIWAPKARWLRAFREAGVDHLFEGMVFSSDGPWVKPHPMLFRKALAILDLPPRAAVVVGDDPLRDMHGARRAGLGCIMVGRARPEPGALACVPDITHLCGGPVEV